jgi:hypothetical protein
LKLNDLGKNDETEQESYCSHFVVEDEEKKVYCVKRYKA